MFKTFYKITATKEGRKMAKEAFRKVFRKHKAEVRRTKKTKGAVPTVDYKLKKDDLKRKIRGTKLVTKAEIKATPGQRRKIILRIEKAKRAKGRFKGPIISGKAYASDKPGKTMQVQPINRLDRRRMLREMADAADKGYKKVRMRKLGYEKGGDVKTVKMVASKLEKASKAHAGQAKKLRGIIKKYV